MSEVSLETLGDRLEELEDSFFVGRSQEFGLFLSLLEQVRSAPTVLYVHGPAGIGKSALVRAYRRAVRDRGIPHILFAPKQASAGIGELLGALSGALQVRPAGDAGTSLGRMASEMNRMAEKSRFILFVDAPRLLEAHASFLLERFLAPLGAGVMAVLTGHGLPAALWPRDLAWQRTVHALELGGLHEGEVRSLLDRVRVGKQAVHQLVWELTLGRPSEVNLLVGALLSHPELHASTRGADDGAASFLIEQFLHPRSRRQQWRGLSEHAPKDRALAAASVLPRFDWPVLGAMLGAPAAKEAWPQVRTWAEPLAEAGYALRPGLSRHLKATMAQVHPWTVRTWRYRALRHYSQKVVAERSAYAWAQLTDLALEIPAFSWLRPQGEQPGWSLCREPSEEAPSPNPTASLPAVRFVLRERSHELGSLSFLEGTPAREALLKMAPHLEGHLPDNPLLWVSLTCGLPAGAAALLGHAWRSIRPGQKVYAQGEAFTLSGGPSSALRRLGFKKVASCPGLLEIDPLCIPYRRWIKRLLLPGIAPEHRLAATQEALSAFHDPSALMHTAAGKLLGKTSPFAVRTWLLDAISGTDFGADLPTAKAILTLYYIECAGQHEEIAERLNLSRTTYFRHLRKAMRHLGESLFALPGAP